MSDPYGNLDPRAEASSAEQEAGILRAVGRGLRKRCPRCAERRIFEGWTTLRATCPRCALRFEQEEGGFLGAMVLNYTFAFLVWMVILAVVLAFTVPEVPEAPLIVMSVVVLVGVPLWFYPRSKATWAAIEWLANRTSPDYRPAAERDARSRRLD
jgi:uncharacterized protein (DUF983 family)